MELDINYSKRPGSKQFNKTILCSLSVICHKKVLRNDLGETKCFNCMYKGVDWVACDYVDRSLSYTCLTSPDTKQKWASMKQSYTNRPKSGPNLRFMVWELLVVKSRKWHKVICWNKICHFMLFSKIKFLLWSTNFDFHPGIAIKRDQNLDQGETTHWSCH